MLTLRVIALGKVGLADDYSSTVEYEGCMLWIWLITCSFECVPDHFTPGRQTMSGVSLALDKNPRVSKAVERTPVATIVWLRVPELCAFFLQSVA